MRVAVAAANAAALGLDVSFVVGGSARRRAAASTRCWRTCRMCADGDGAGAGDRRVRAGPGRCTAAPTGSTSSAGWSRDARRRCRSLALEIGCGAGRGGGALLARRRLRLGRARARPGRDRAGRGRAAVSGTSRRRSSAASSVGGVAVFPADTVYGLACDPRNRLAVERLYRLKRRPLEQALGGDVLRLSISRSRRCPSSASRHGWRPAELLPGRSDAAAAQPGGALPARLRRRSGDAGTAGAGRAALAGVRWPVLQSSANRRRRRRGPARSRRFPSRCAGRRTCVLDGGELPGTASTVVDLRALRGGRGSGRSCARGRCAFDADRRRARGAVPLRSRRSYREMIRADIPVYDELPGRSWSARRCAGRRAGRGGSSSSGPGRGRPRGGCCIATPRRRSSGSTPARPMLDAARAALPAERVELRAGRLEEPLPAGPFDLVASALCVHHLRGRGEGRAVRPGAPPCSHRAGGSCSPTSSSPTTRPTPTTPLSEGFDHPSPVAEQLEWLDDAGFDARGDVGGRRSGCDRCVAAGPEISLCAAAAADIVARP